MITPQSPIFVKTVGAGTPIVFLHGFLEDYTVWNSIYPDFVNEGFQCILVDLPCHGQSRFQGEICTMTFMAREVFRYLQRNTIQNPFVFGHSMGGYVGLELLRLMEIRLTLVHSNFWADAETKKLDRNRVIDVVKKSKRLFLNESIPNLFAPLNREFRREEIDLLIEKADRLDTTEIIASTGGLRDRLPAFDLMDQHKINMIHGSNDPVVPDGILESELGKLKKRPVIYRIENCGHMSFIEQPVTLINHMRTIVFQ